MIKSIKIMCIGDSITFGYKVPGSYRKFLYNGLTKKGHKITMVGSKKSPCKVSYKDEITGETFEYEDVNSGYSAYAIKSYSGRNGIFETLKETDCLSEKPDIIILQIGTNNVVDKHDKNENSKDYDLLLDYILENISSNTMLFVATIPDVDPNRNEVYNWFTNHRHSDDLKINYDDNDVEKKVKDFLNFFNSDICEKVKKRNELGYKNIRVGNLNSAITDVKTQLFDGVHPNNKGYKAMGEFWVNIIDNYINEINEK